MINKFFLKKTHTAWNHLKANRITLVMLSVCFMQPAKDKVEADLKYTDKNRNNILMHYFSFTDCKFTNLIDYSVPSE